MNLQDTPTSYGGISRLNHWLGALLIVSLLGIGLYFGDMPRGDEKAYWLRLHISLGLIVLLPLAFRVLWRMIAGWPRPVRQHANLQRLTGAVHKLLLLGITIMLISGPLLPWTNDFPLQIFDSITLASPIGKLPVLHEAVEEIHVITSRVLMVLIGIHILGALKHTVLNRDGTLRRMLGAPVTEQ